MKIIAALTLLAIPLLTAQDEVKPPVEQRRVFEMKYVIPSRMASLVGRIVDAQPIDALNVLVIRGSKVQMDEGESFIKRFDVPPPPVPNVEVTIYLMSALGQPVASNVPSELEPVVKQLKGMFSYKAYQLIDTQVIRTRAGGGGDTSGVVDNGSAMKTISQAKFMKASISSDEKGRVIRIDGLKVGLKVPTLMPRSATKTVNEYQYIETGISTDIDVHEGQKVVVGKANMDGSDRASIVVLTAKVVD